LGRAVAVSGAQLNAKTNTPALKRTDRIRSAILSPPESFGGSHLLYVSLALV